jgi:hypothetical protein
MDNTAPLNKQQIKINACSSPDGAVNFRVPKDKTLGFKTKE